MVNQTLMAMMVIKRSFYLFSLFVVLCIPFNTKAQEGLRPLNSNVNIIYSDLRQKNGNDKNLGAALKTSTTSLSLPFIDDFSYSCKQSYPSQLLWSDSSTYINNGHGHAPVSFGVATFDGLNKFGYPYQPNLINMNSSLPADTLTSKPINLQGLSPSDSIVLSFFYQARGNGESPEVTDSLLLDFYKPYEDKWATDVWYKKGNTSANTNDTVFKFAFVTVADTSYLHDGFKFRFRNKATTAGDFDHWHLDYVWMDKLRTNLPKDTAINDFTFGYIPTPFLVKYAEMPWRQYQPAENGNPSVFIRNNGQDISSITTSYRMEFFDATNTSIYTYSNIATNAQNPGYFNKSGWHKFQGFSNPNSTTTFTNPLPSTFTSSTTYKIVHSITAGTSADFRTQNDTVTQFQSFKNYYAFDDGSAEGGYYILGQGGKMAQRITLNTTDTLSAVRIYFDPVGSISTATVSYKFRIKLWTSNSLGYPETLLYTDSAMYPFYPDKAGFNAQNQYTLTSPLVLSAGDYFVGIQQFVATGITVGFDKNLDHSTSLYYDSGSGWTQSTIYGSLMMRPVFGGNPGPVGVKELLPSKNKVFSIYPNPSNEAVSIVSENNGVKQFLLCNALGQVIISGSINESIYTLNTADIREGIYFLTVQSQKQVQTQKLIIRH